MEKERLKILLLAYRSGELTDAGWLELSQFISTDASRYLVVEVLSGEALDIDADAVYDNERFDPILRRILSVDKQVSVRNMYARRTPVWKRIAVAASFILIASLALWHFNKKDTVVTPGAPVTVARDVAAPSSNHATITMSDGRTILLDSASNGKLATINNVSVVKTADGKIAFQSSAAPVTVRYSTLNNPRGSKVIDMTLADGSRVWLNAGSSITFPEAFVGNERKVQVNGEAYFEVTHDVSKPFYVTKGETEVKVLGTHFNVNAYDDEQAIKVTLLEGSVQVSNQKGSIRIKPGEQAVTIDHSPLTIDRSPDLDEVMAWKNGLFSFKEADLPSIMREVSRWYDVDITFEKPVTERFYAELSRTTNVSGLLKILEATKAVHFKVEGKKITVIPD